MTNIVSLKTMLLPDKQAEVEYPGMPGFKVKLAYLSRETIQKIRKKSTKITFKNRQQIEETNDELFLKLYVQESVRGWTGLKMSYLEQLAPVDLGGMLPDDELEYSDENALYLMKASINFDNFVSEQISDLGNFTESSKMTSSEI